VVSSVLAGRLGAAISNLVVGSLIDVSCEIPVMLIAAMALGKNSETYCT